MLDQLLIEHVAVMSKVYVLAVLYELEQEIVRIRHKYVAELSPGQRQFALLLASEAVTRKDRG